MIPIQLHTIPLVLQSVAMCTLNISRHLCCAYFAKVTMNMNKVYMYKNMIGRQRIAVGDYTLLVAVLLCYVFSCSLRIFHSEIM